MKGTIVTMLLLAAVCSAPAKSESLAEAWALALKTIARWPPYGLRPRLPVSRQPQHADCVIRH